MRYKTKRTILRITRYLIYSALIFFAYVYAAHRNYLPAFFEYYTGDLVRESTSRYYQKYLGDEKDVSTGHIDVINLVDFILREPSYLYISDILDTLSSESSEIPQKVRDESVSVATFPALIEWLKKPKGNFASVYQYESIRFMESSESFKTFLILDKKGNVIHKSGKIAMDYGTLKNNPEIMYYNGLLSIPVKSGNTILGRVISLVENNVSSALSFQNTGMDISWFWTGSDNKIYSSYLSNNIIKKWIQSGKFSDPSGGITDGFRIIRRNVNHNKLILVYPAESLTYYLFRVLVYVVFLTLIGLIFYFWQRSGLFEIVKRRVIKIGENKTFELLEKSNMVNQEFAALAAKYQNSMQSMKIQELDRLRLISEHLTYLHKSVYKAREENVLEVKNLE